jgi:protein TonB
MKTYSFWIALTLSGCVHGLAYGAIFVIWLFHAPATSPPIALVAYGNSSVPGLAVDAISLDPPGTFRQGDSNTPGGDDAPKEQPKPEEDELPPPPAEVVALPNQDPLPEPVSPQEPEKPAAGTQLVMRPVSDPSKDAKLPGAPGGSTFPIGKPSKGGEVGSTSGLRIAGLAKAVYPREAIVRGIEGKVVLFVAISAEGKVTEVRLHKSSGSKILDDAALSHGWTLKFIPARENYQPVAATALYPVTYELTSR